MGGGCLNICVGLYEVLMLSSSRFLYPAPPKRLSYVGTYILTSLMKSFLKENSTLTDEILNIY